MKRIAALGLAAMALAGCGGGGGSDSPSNAAPAQIEALNTWKNFLAADRTYVTRGNGSDGAAYEISTTIRPRGAAQMNIPNEFPTATPLVTYNSVEVTTSVRRNSAVYSNATLLFYVLPSDFSVKALIDPSLPACILPDSDIAAPAIPATAALNASGLLFGGGRKVEMQGTTGCMKHYGFLNTPSHHTMNWWYITDGGRPMFCVNYRTQVLGSQIRDQESCFEVLNGNSIGGAARVSVKAETLNLVTKNF